MGAVESLMYPPYVLAALMMMIEAVFSICLYMECRKLF